VRNAVGRHDAHLFQPDRPVAVVEEPDASAEQHWRDADLDLVELPKPEELLCDARAADPDHAVARGFARELERALHAFRDERDTGAPFTRDRRLVRDDEDRHVDRVATLPAVGDVERPPPADDGARRAHPLVDDDLALVGRREVCVYTVRL